MPNLIFGEARIHLKFLHASNLFLDNLNMVLVMFSTILHASDLLLNDLNSVLVISSATLNAFYLLLNDLHSISHVLFLLIDSLFQGLVLLLLKQRR